MRRHLERATAIVLLAAMETAPAFAAGIDVENGTNTLVTALLVVFGLIILGVAGWKGIEAVMDHRSVMPSLIGLVIGVGLTFGGAWFLAKMGAGT